METDTAVSSNETTSLLKLADIRKEYPTPGSVVHAVAGADLSIDRGEFVAILGPSGSGKTTFLFLAAGLLQPDGGKVLFREQDLSSSSKREALRYRREELGFIFQDFNLIPGLSALDNVAVPRMLAGVSQREARIEAGVMLERVGLAARAKHPPSQLSGGEQQRVAVARALTGKPSLILADEPTGNLDTKKGSEVLALLRDLSNELSAAVVLVTHDTRAAEYAGRVQEMRDGQLFEHGNSTSELVEA